MGYVSGNYNSSASTRDKTEILLLQDLVKNVEAVAEALLAGGGGTDSGVKTVTGDGVDNTDPLNPVMVLSDPATAPVTSAAGANVWDQSTSSWAESREFADIPLWTYLNTTDTTVDPGAGNVVLDSLVPANVTQIALSITTNQGVELEGALGNIVTGAILAGREYGAFANNIVFQITGIIDNGTWLRYDVTILSSGNAATANTDVTLSLLDSGQGVRTITGDGVNNADPRNPVISYPASFYEFIDSADYTRPGQTTEGLISNSNLDEDYLTLVFTPTVTGVYEISCFYEWSVDVTNRDFIASLEIFDDTPTLVSTIAEHRQQPKNAGGSGEALNVLFGGAILPDDNSGTDQRHLASANRSLNLTAGTEYTVYLRWRCENNNTMATIYRGNISVELKKI